MKKLKLYYTPTSPFVRKVMVCAHELGLADRIETTFLRPTPVKTDAVLSKENPLSKIPTLILEDGSSLYDSSVICEYLDSIAPGGPKMIPASGPERFRVLRVHALCDGILEAAVQVFYERQHRPKELQYEPWLSGQTEKANQGLDALEREVGSSSSAVDLGQVAAGVTIGWLEFRNVLGDLRGDLRPNRPDLFAWYDAFRARPSMRDTAPHA